MNLGIQTIDTNDVASGGRVISAIDVSYMLTTQKLLIQN
jgi:hypothetical protein